jgi:hypothetical protein
MHKQRTVKRLNMRWDRQRPIPRGGQPAPPAPAVLSSLNPTSVVNNVSTPVTITGTGFVSGCTVQVDGTTFPSGAYVSATQATFDAMGSVAGTQQITVTNPGTSASNALTLTVT